MNKIAVVAQREFLSTVKRRSYLIVTFGMPFFVSIYLFLVGVLPTILMESSAPTAKESGLVDEAAVVSAEVLEHQGEGGLEPEMDALRKLLRGSKAEQTAAGMLEKATAEGRLRTFPSRDEALTALRAGKLERVYVLPKDYLETGGIETFQRFDEPVSFRTSPGRETLERVLSRSLMSGRIPEALRALVEQPIRASNSRRFTIDDQGTVAVFDATAKFAKLFIPLAFSILFFMSVMVSSGYLLQGVSEEKENRVIEVILSSVRPDQLLTGKLLGLGAAGLLQLVIWISVSSLATGLMAAAILAALDFKLFVGCLIFFVLGFLMLGSLMTGTAALGTNARESQQMATIWSTLTIVPAAVTFTSVIQAPNGAMARALGWFPLTAPITMILRLGTGQVPWWDVLISAACLLAGVYLAIRGAASLFRLGLLMYGKRPTLKEIARQLRNA